MQSGLSMPFIFSLFISFLLADSNTIGCWVAAIIRLRYLENFFKRLWLLCEVFCFSFWYWFNRHFRTTRSLSRTSNSRSSFLNQSTVDSCCFSKLKFRMHSNAKICELNTMGSLALLFSGDLLLLSGVIVRSRLFLSKTRKKNYLVGKNKSLDEQKNTLHSWSSESSLFELVFESSSSLSSCIELINWWKTILLSGRAHRRLCPQPRWSWPPFCPSAYEPTAQANSVQLRFTN